MTQYLNHRSYLFHKPCTRVRVARMLVVLGVLTIINVLNMAAKAQDDAFSRLGARSSFAEETLADDGSGRFTIAGGGPRFEFVRTGRRATIRFLCSPGPSCPPAARKAQPLIGEPTGRGDIVFKSQGGIAVLRVTATGGATLYGGASFVPVGVPRSGRAVVPLS